MRTLITFLTLCIASIAIAQTPTPHDRSVREGHLPNGLTYFIRHNNQTPGQADFYIAQRVGSILEEPNQRGLAHFLEHMAFNGTQHFPDGNGGERSVRNWCEKNGMKFGADLNAYTSVDRTVYNISNAPVSKSGIADTCLLILHDWSNYLLLKDEEIDQERGVIHEEWRTRRSNMASTRIMEEAVPVIFQGSKYADCLPIGSIEVVDTFHHDALRNYYKKWYRTDLQAIIVVGDVNVDETEAKIKAIFSTIPAPDADAAERIYFPVPDNEEMYVFTKGDDEQPTLNMNIFMKNDATPRAQRSSIEEFTADYKSRLALFILRQRLAELPKEATPAVMSVSCRNGNFYVSDEKSAFYVSLGLFPERPKDGIDKVISTIEKARLFGFTEDELEHAKMQFNVNLEHRIDNREKTHNSEYIAAIVGHFCNGSHLMSIDDEANLEHSLMESVTLEDVNATIREIVLAPDTKGKNHAVICYGPTQWNGEPYALPTAAQLKSWIIEAENRQYEDDIDRSPVDRTFMKKLPKKGKILARNDYGNGYTEYVLSNGMKVYARPSDIEPNRLTLRMFREGGKSLYPDSDIISMKWISNVILQCGAADFDKNTLEKKRAGKALRVTPYFDAEEEGVSGVCAASDFKTWLQVAHLYITQPRRDDAIFSSMISRQRSMLRNRDANPNVVFNDSLRTHIYTDLNRTRPLSLANLDSISLTRILEIYKERFSNMYGMKLIVTGDIRTDEFEELICQYVASLPGRKPKYGKKSKAPAEPIYLEMKKGHDTCEFNHNMTTPSALTNIIYSADMPYNADMDLRADVLGQIMRAIYTEKVREEKGGTYGVSVKTQGYATPRDAFTMTINFRCAPEKYSELLPIIDAELQKMANEGPTEEQLDKVKKYELKNYERVYITNGWWEHVCYHMLSKGIDFEKDYKEKVNSLTPADIRDFCRSLLSQNNRIQVTMLPKQEIK